MDVRTTEIPQVKLITPRILRDRRGHFLETWHQERYRAAGILGTFSQDNVSSSLRGVVRGLHFQHPHGQGKLIGVLVGEIFDVAVDIRRGSPTFGRWVGCTLSDSDHRQLYVPPGFAHGFCVSSAHALVAYKCTAPYHPEAEGGIRWDDPELGIPWPITDPVLSTRDAALPRLSDIDPLRLPDLPPV